MKSVAVTLSLLAGTLLVSGAPQVSPSPTCTITQIVNPGGNGAPNCVFAGHTKTKVVQTDCSGCALTTQTLRVPIPCTKVSTNKASTTTVTSLKCKASPTCTKTVGPPPFDEGPTCTSYRKVVTSTSTLGCTGCAVSTLQLGPGPVRRCSTTVTKATSTFVKKVCTPASGPTY